VCHAQKAKLKLCRVLYEKQGSLKQKNLLLDASAKHTVYNEIDPKEKVSVYIHNGKVVPMVEGDEDSSSEESIELLNDESIFHNQNESKDSDRLDDTTSKVDIPQELSESARDTAFTNRLQSETKKEVKFSSAKDISSLPKAALKLKSLEHSFNHPSYRKQDMASASPDCSMSKMTSGRDAKLGSQNMFFQYPVMPSCNPPPGFEKQERALPGYLPFAVMPGQFTAFPQYPNMMFGVNPAQQLVQSQLSSMVNTNSTVKNPAKARFFPKENAGMNMNKNSKAFMPKDNARVRFARAEAVNKTQIHIEDLSIMDESDPKAENSFEYNRLVIDPNAKLSQSVNYGKISPLNLDASRFEPGNSKNASREPSETKNEAESSRAITQVALPVVTNQKLANSAMASASPNSNVVLQKPEVIAEETEESSFLMFDEKVFKGQIKFFNQLNKYGFILQDSGEKDIFFHFEDIKNNKVPKKFLRQADTDLEIRVSYQIKAYQGKNKFSTKAVNIKIENMMKKDVSS